MDEAAGRSRKGIPALERATLKTLTQRGDRKGLVRLGGHLALLALTGTLVLASRGSLWLVPAMAVHGGVLVFLFAPLHECIHRTAFERRRLNDTVAALCGALLLLPAGYFRAFHLDHHRFTQDPARDPELSGRPLRHRGDYLLHVSGLPYWRERLATTLRHAAGRITESFLPPQLQAAIRREAQAHLVVYVVLAAASLVAGSAILLWLWVVPVLLGQPLLRLYLLAEHSGCPQVPDMLANSRTTETNRALALLCWNMNRHTAHHAFPAIPFHALPAADRLLTPHITVRSRGYRAVQRQIWESLAGA